MTHPVILREVAGPTRTEASPQGWVLRLRFAARRMTAFALLLAVTAQPGLAAESVAAGTGARVA